MLNTISAARFAEAYSEGRQKTINFLLSSGFAPQLAEEAAQAAWVRGWERRNQLRDPNQPLPWINSIALNMGRTMYRRASRLHGLVDAPVWPGSRVIAKVDIQNKLLECPLRERSLLAQRYLNDCDLQDMADEHRCTPRAMRIRLYRARQNLKKRFEHRGPSANTVGEGGRVWQH